MAHAALTLGVAQLTIVDTDQARAEYLAAGLAQRFGKGSAAELRNLAAVVSEADGVINATPVGMANYPGLPMPAELLRHDLWVADIVYFPLETELLRQARMLGCRTLDGGGMAVFQAAEAFRLFTGVTPDAELMRRHPALWQRDFDPSGFRWVDANDADQNVIGFVRFSKMGTRR